jgi:hypothetical protein
VTNPTSPKLPTRTSAEEMLLTRPKTPKKQAADKQPQPTKTTNPAILPEKSTYPNKKTHQNQDRAGKLTTISKTNLALKKPAPNGRR